MADEPPGFPVNPNAGRRPRFKTRLPGADPSLTNRAPLRAHIPPETSSRLSLPEPVVGPSHVYNPLAGILPTPRPVEAPPAAASEKPVESKASAEETPPIAAPLTLNPPGANPASPAAGTLPAWARAEPLPQQPRSRAVDAIIGLVLLGIGAAMGLYFKDSLRKLLPGEDEETTSASAAAHPSAAAPARAERLDAEALEALDTAFYTMKSSSPGKARDLFGELIKAHPGWDSLFVERARAAMYQRDGTGAKSLVDTGVKAGSIPPAEADFLSALLRMTANDFNAASLDFERAASEDPARPDIFFFWGDCLRRLGKPDQAVSLLRSAQLRNQYESAEGLYRLKLWLATIQANSETTNGIGAAMDADLASPRPSGYTLIAAAARDIREGQISQAADHLREAAKTIDPPVFALAMHDVTFLPESWRPELAEFFPKPGGAGAPKASPSPAASGAPAASGTPAAALPTPAPSPAPAPLPPPA